jgi:hypothetical protein
VRGAVESSPFICNQGHAACPVKPPAENPQRSPIRKAVCPIKPTRESSQRPPIKIATHASEGSLACPSPMRGDLGESKAEDLLHKTCRALFVCFLRVARLLVAEESLAASEAANQSTLLWLEAKSTV